MLTHRLLFLLPVATGFLLGCQPQSAPETNVAPDVPPNIVFLLTDDQRWDAAGFMNNDIVQTPHLDSLAAQGTVFENAYVTTAICAISRASILTGQYASRHGILDFDTSLSDSAFRQTYPAQLQQAGYYTGFVGKYGIGTLDSVTARERFDQWYGFNGQGKYEHTDEDGNYVHLTRIMGDQSLAFLGGVPDNRPFCLSVSFKAPHVQDVDPRQFVYDTAYSDLYTDITIPVPETADPRYFDQLPDYLQTSEARHRWQMRFATPEAYQESVKGYYRLIAGVDDVVGRIKDALRRLGRTDNTIIVLTGDNGFYLGEHGLAGKWYGHEESIRVPCSTTTPGGPKRSAATRSRSTSTSLPPCWTWPECPYRRSCRGAVCCPWCGEKRWPTGVRTSTTNTPSTCRSWWTRAGSVRSDCGPFRARKEWYRSIGSTYATTIIRRPTKNSTICKTIRTKPPTWRTTRRIRRRKITCEAGCKRSVKQRVDHRGRASIPSPP